MNTPTKTTGFSGTMSGAISRRSGTLLPLIISGLLASPGLVSAADTTWQNSGTDFNTSANWSSGTPGAGDVAVFANARTTNPALSASLTIQELNFSSITSSGYILSSGNGSLLTLTNTGTGTVGAISAANTSGTNTISLGLVLGAATGATQTFTQAAGGTLALSGPITEANSGVKLAFAGNGTFVLTGSNSYTGNTIIGESASANTIVSAQSNDAFGTGAGTVSVSAASELNLQGNVTISKNLTLNGSGRSNTTGNLRNISGNNEWAGNISIVPGTIRIVSDAGNLKISGNVTPTGGTSLSLQGNGNGEVSGIISGGMSLGHSSSGNGTWILSGANTYTGATNIGNGALSVSSLNSVSGGVASSSLGAPTTIANGTIGLGSSAAAGKLIYTGSGETTDRVINLVGTGFGGTIDQSGTGLLKFTSNLTATGTGSKTLTLQGSSSGTGEISGAIVDGSGVTSLNKSGTGTWTASGANTYTGTTTIAAGVLSASNIVVSGGASNLGNATSAVVLGDATNKGTLSYTGGDATFTRGFTLNNGGGQINVTNSLTTLTISTGAITGGRRLVLGGNGRFVINSDVNGDLFQDTGTVTLNGVLSGASTILKYGGLSGSGTFTVTNAANSFAGGVTTGGWNALNVNSSVVFANTGSNSALGSAGTITINNNAVNLAGFSVDQTTNRTWNIGNTNAAINNNGSAKISLTGIITNNVGANGVLSLGGSYTAGINSISGAISNGSNTLGLRVSAGKWELLSASTYSGNTTVSAGTLYVNNTTGSGTGSGTVAVNGGTLGGSGSISGVVTVNSGGTLAPGNSPGVLSVGSLVLNAGSTSVFEINGSDRGVTYDAINILTGGSIQFGGAFNLGFGSALANGTWNLFSFDGTSTGDFSSVVSTGMYEGTWSKEGEVWSLNSGAATLSFSEATGALTVVPEPETMSLIVVALTVLMLFRKRRRTM